MLVGENLVDPVCKTLLLLDFENVQQAVEEAVFDPTPSTEVQGEATSDDNDNGLDDDDDNQYNDEDDDY